MTGVNTHPLGPVVLGVETSCDETGIGIMAGSTLLADALASSVEEHARFGGVVPEVAARAHVEAFLPTLRRALTDARLRLADVDAVAVTTGPGLAGALLTGVGAAKALAAALGVPLYGVHHLAAHVAVDIVEHGELPQPCVALLVSGGHTSLLAVEDLASPTGLRSLGVTVDDAAGEAFDKVARLLGLGFPGGPVIDRLAREGDPAAVAFPRGKGSDGTFDFSFSGLKTAVARYVTAAGGPAGVAPADVAAAFQESVVDVLTAKAVAACRAEGITDLVLGGGVAANSRLRVLAAQRAAAAGVRLRVPSPRLCTDNGAMVAALGSLLVARGAAPAADDVGVDAALPLVARGLGGQR